MSDKKKKQIKISLISCLAVLMVALITFTTLGIIFSNRKKAPGETVVNPLEWSVDEWDGESEDDLHWFSGDEYANRGEKSYTIDSVASFIYFVNITNDATLAREYDYFKDYTVYLNTNLNLNGHAMKSIGMKVDTGDSVISTFQGTFDGSYYTIHNATIDGAGLFGYVENATIKNVGLYNATIDSTDDYVGGIVGYAINTNIEDTYVRLGSVTGAGTVGGLVGKMLSTNGTYHITNSFADTSITGVTRGGLVGNVDCNTMDANIINLDYCYYTGEYTATGNTVTNLSTNNVFRAADIGQFYAWDYEPSYSLAYTWCNYSFAPNSTELSFSYPILTKFNKVFMTGSCYENTVVSLDESGAVSSEASNVTTIADAFDLADDNETVKVEMIVEQATMDTPAIVKANAEVWLDTEKNIDITRSNTMSDVLITAGENASLVIGSDDNTNTITIDGNRDYVEANNLQSSAMIVINAEAGSNIGANVTLQNNTNNMDGNGGIIAIVDGEEYRNVETVRNNLNLLTSSSSVRPRRTTITTSGTSQVSSNISGGSATNGGGLYVSISSTTGTTVIGVIADITSCTASSNGGGVYLYGARTSSYRNFLFGSGVTSSSVDSSVILRGNKARNGGGINARGSNISNGWTIKIYGSIDNNSSTGNGGGIFLWQANSLQLQSTGRIFYNSTSSNGGGISDTYGRSTITGGSTSRVYSNTASGEGDNTYGISTRTVTLYGRGSSSSSVTYEIQYLDSCPEYKPTGYFDWNSRTIRGWASSSSSTSVSVSGSSTNIKNTSTTDSTNTYYMVVKDINPSSTTTESYSNLTYQVSFNANTTGYSGSTDTLTAYIYRGRYKYTYNIYGYAGNTLGSTTSYGSPFVSRYGSVTLPILTKDGYTFNGWRLGSTSGTLYDGGTSFSYSSSCTMYGDWSVSTYKITFDENGGSSVNDINYDITDTITLPSTSRNGYTFAGWKPSSSVGNWSTSTTYVSTLSGHYYGNVTLVAQWNRNTYSITFNENGGSSVNNISYNITSTTTLPSTSRNGYTFNGWRPISSGGGWSSSTNYAAGYSVRGKYASIIMNAQWTLNTYKITFNENGGSSVNDISYNITSTTKLPSTSRTGYTFAGWRPASSSGGWSSSTNYGAGTSVNGKYASITMNAQWTTNTYTINFDENGGNSVNNISYNITSTITLPTPTRSGYSFQGWKPSSSVGNWSSGTTYPAGSRSGMYGNVTLVAQWRDSQAPVISRSIWVQNGDDQYYVYAYVTDNVGVARVQFPTWTSHNGQDDIQSNWETNSSATGTAGSWTVSGSSYNYRYLVEVSDHNDEYGEYNTHIYAYDAAGNRYSSDDTDCNGIYLSWDVTFDENGGSAVSDIHYNIISTDTLPSTAKTGYTFAGWKPSSTSGSWSSGSTYAAGTSLAGKHGTVTLVAQWTVNTYKITFNENGGNAVSDINYNITSTTTLPSTTRNGYTFAGWKPTTSAGGWNSGATYTAGTSVIGKYASITMDAQWTANTYQITFDENGGSTVSDIDYNITSTTTLPSTSRDGYTFAGWKPSASSGNWSSSVTYTAGTSLTGQYGSVTLVAQWTINTYTISFDEAGGNEISDINYTITSTTTLPSTTRNGYTFAGWKPTTSAGGWNSGTTYTAGTSVNGKYASITMTAQWTINTYTITFDEDGGTPVNDMEYNINSTSTLPITSRNGYAFLGWKPTTSAGGWNSNDIYGEGSEVTGKYADITLVAQWSEPIDYQITFDEAGGSDVSDISYNITSTTTLPSTTRNGYTFAGWKPETNEGNWDTGRNYSANTSVSGQYGNVTLVAQWTVISYTITFNENGGSAVDDITHNIDSTATLPSTTRNGYTFAGWKPSSTAGGWDASVNYPAGTSVNGKYASITMVAQWNATPYTITFDEAGGNAVSDINYTIESTATLPSTAKAGYTFNGWKPETSVGSWSNSQTYSAGTTLTGKYGSVTMVAQWTVQTYDIHYYDQGGETFSGTFSGAYPTTHTYGTATTLVSPTKANYIFDGWFVNSACTGSPITTIGATSYTSDIDLYAKWTINAHTVTINVNNSAYGKVSLTSVEAPHGSTITTSGATLTIRSGSETIATITATANAGYMFESWTNASGTVTADKTITANFVKTVEINIEVVGLNSDETYGVYYDDTTYTNDFNMVSGGTLRILASTGAGNGENSYRIVSVYRNNTREVGPYSGEITTTGITGSTWENVTDDVTIRFEFKYGYKIETEVTESNTDGVTVDAGDEVTNEGIISSDAAVTIEIDLDTLLGGADNKEYLGIVYKEQGSDSTSSIGTEGGGVLSGSQSGNKYTYTVEEGAIIDSITVIVKEIVPITLTWHTGDPSTIQLVSEEGFIRVLTNGSSSYNLYASKWEITVSSGSVDLNDLKAIFSNNANNVTQEGGKFYLTLA